MTPSAWVVAGGFAGIESGGMAGAAGNVLVVLVLVVLDVWARAGVTDKPRTAAAANSCLCRLMAGRLAVEDLTAAPYPPEAWVERHRKDGEAESFRGLDNIILVVELVASNGRHRRQGNP